MTAPEAAPSPFLNPRFLEDPYPLLAMLRSNNPVMRLPVMTGSGAPEGPGEFLLTRYADVQRVLREPAFSAERERSEAVRRNASQIPEEMRPENQPRTMLGLDPPEHTRQRGLVNRAFTPRRVEALAPRIQSIVDGLVAPLADRDEFDLVRELAEPLPAIVIAELLGVPAEDHRLIKAWSSDLVAVLDGALTADRLPRLREARRNFDDYFRRFIAERREEPRDDLLSGLIAARDEQDALSEGELLATCMLILVAGHETTTNLIGNAVLALLRHPEECERWRKDPGLDAALVEESLRFDSPVQITARAVTAPARFGDVDVAPGALVTVALGAANRDPERFPEPDRFDVGRDDNQHLAFGHGLHFCLGAGLARLESRLALRSLFDAIPGLELAPDGAERRASFVLRGLSRLVVRRTGPA